MQVYVFKVNLVLSNAWIIVQKKKEKEKERGISKRVSEGGEGNKRDAVGQADGILFMVYALSRVGRRASGYTKSSAFRYASIAFRTRSNAFLRP